jgi:mono/diheme cytochrome c family protein
VEESGRLLDTKPVKNLRFLAITISATVLFTIAVLDSTTSSSASTGAASAATVTYDRIAPIFQARCVACHSDDGAGPFPLTSYDDVQQRATVIAAVVRSRYMPPWLPSKDSGPFVHQRRLSDEQIGAIETWIAAGAPQGRATNSTAEAPSTPAWPLGTPDMILKMDRPYMHAADSDQVYRNFILPALPRDVWIRAIDFKPSNPRVVRFAALLIDEAGKADKLQERSGAVGYAAFEAGLSYNTRRIAEWSPDSAPIVFPSGVGEHIPAGAKLVLLLKLENTGEPEQEQSEVALYFSPTPPSRQAETIRFGEPMIYLLPTQKATIADTFTLPVNCEVLGLMPHGHSTVRTMHLNAVMPNKSVRTLVQFDDWNAAWQEPLTYTNPPRLPAGTRLLFRCNIDNSDANPRNPAKPAMDVLPTYDDMDEMAGMQVVVAPVSPADSERLTGAIAARRSAAIIAKTYAVDPY